MCGFFITNHPSINKKEHESILENTLRFRGPDGASGLIESGKWMAYHSRLSIIDLNSGINQPVKDTSGGMLVFNGEILNYKALGYKYFQKEFESDTILLSELIKNKVLSISELDGFFSFVYINNKNEIKYAVRDRFGVKPLFYYQDGEYLAFSSEPNTLKSLFNLDINQDSIDEYKATRSPIFCGSYFKGILQVNPGQCLITGYYFDASKYLNGKYQNVSKNELLAAITKGINSRKISDAPIGLLLSKGVDSNLLKSIGDFDRYYSIGFEGDADIEYLHSKNIKNLKIITCTPSEYLHDFNYLLKLRGEPLSVPNEVLLYQISKEAAKDGIKVLLSGEGADEFFAGYDRIFKWASEANEFNLDTFLDMYCYIPPQKNSTLYNKFQELFNNIDIKSTFEKVRWFFIRYHMPVLFRRLDFALMAAGVEGREPIANQHVFNIAIKCSAESLMDTKLGKVPLRELLSDYMGHDFAYEKKVGFPVDLQKVFPNEEKLSSYELWFKENLKVLNK
ncbi:asparagine synthetase B family protein [Providencia rettgeri]|uniref:asparagine synthetase B family protein n=3 Tax=Providencia rettgeri TaxID=587 RepID=UPI001B39424D|nr:asparagine synthase-related protein [Providencia rettgeri]MBQ0439805.1 asparagine synthase [Providencia rettgeri]MBX6969490.1 asparagine synthase [Providencia rettgeri]MBX6976641.1 asparagine synthase [Providencia rettgeri]MBX6995443.1 asparagine synthase [Providencia rettgeri]MBX7022673.1 asparagine synthase [Providencia rettgeri]